MPVFGKCRLCLGEADLFDSHIIPRWAWKRSRADSLKNPNVARLGGGVARQDQSQVHEHMLCRPCEERMKWGEDYAHEVTYQRDRSAKFLELVGPDIFQSNGVRVALPGRLDVARIAYFGLSVIWRASVARSVPECRLSEWAEESLRRYLLQEAPFDDDLSCAVKFHDTPFESQAVTSIYSLPACDGAGAVFLFFGLVVKLESGEAAKELRPLCALHSPQNWVFLAPQEDIADWLADWFNEQKPIGSLTTLEKRKA